MKAIPDADNVFALVAGHIFFIMTHKTVRFNSTLHSPSEEVSSSTPAPLFFGFSSLENKTIVVPVSQICCNVFGSSPPIPPSCIVNDLQAKQEVFFLLIGWIPAVCGSVLSASRPCGSTREWQSGRGRMQANHSPVCQLLVLRYQPISCGQKMSVCVFVDSDLSWRCL